MGTTVQDRPPQGIDMSSTLKTMQKGLADLSCTIRLQFPVGEKYLSQIIQKLDLPRQYNKPQLKILDLYAGPSVQSVMLNDLLKPKQHLIMESRPKFVQFNKEYVVGHNGMQIAELDPYEWSSYDKIIKEDKIFTPTVQSREKMHDELLISANVTDLKMKGLVLQWLDCIPNENWLMKYGRVKILLWLPTVTAAKMLAPVGHSKRHRWSLVTETVTDTKLVALTDGNDLNEFDPDLISKWNPIVSESANDIFQSKKSSSQGSSCLLDITPKNVNINADVWNYVAKQLLILKSTPLETSLNSLGHGASEYFKSVVKDPSLLEKLPVQLTTEDMLYLVDIFDNWPFKPNIYFEAFNVYFDHGAGD